MSTAIEAALATTARLEFREHLSGTDLSRMYALLSRHFDGVSANQFNRDVAEKNWVILIERGGRLVGFTTILAYETRFEGNPVSVIYSGDTIVAPDSWNTMALPRKWIESVAMLRGRYRRGPYVWLLITSGFRTYRFLPMFWREFFPRFDCHTPASRQRLIDQLAGERFGNQYDAARGIVRFRNPQRLRGPLATIPAGRIEDPHVGFFASRNPDHEEGDELVCLTELTPANLTASGRRVAGTFCEW
ncbi:MAG TPA: GNAT family N-acetyltransferase [Blastocatellia bacterium]|nr:GNAT family N-acetyltransferase [Blastocatellia bacterium]